MFKKSIKIMFLLFGLLILVNSTVFAATLPENQIYIGIKLADHATGNCLTHSHGLPSFTA